jgi:hypothetical protein
VILAPGRGHVALPVSPPLQRSALARLLRCLLQSFDLLTIPQDEVVAHRRPGLYISVEAELLYEIK